MTAKDLIICINRNLFGCFPFAYLGLFLISLSKQELCSEHYVYKLLPISGHFLRINSLKFN